MTGPLMNKLTCILACLLLFTACNSHNPSSGKTVFDINLDEGLSSLDPAFSRNQNAIWMNNQVYNGLVQSDDSLKTRPCIAKSWDISPDGTLYTFHLRNDVCFHDDPLFPNGKGRNCLLYTSPSPRDRQKSRM